MEFGSTPRIRYSVARGKPKMRLETIAVHAGGEPDFSTGAIAPPLHLSTTFEHGPATEILHGYTYVRDENPTQDRLEAALAQLECPRLGKPGHELAKIQGSHPSTLSVRSGSASFPMESESPRSDAEATTGALVFGSGMGAAAALFQTLEPGSHVIFPEDVYVHVRLAQQEYLPKWNIAASVVDLSGAEGAKNLQRAMRPETRLVWIETPSNPRMNITDIQAVVSAVKEQAGGTREKEEKETTETQRHGDARGGEDQWRVSSGEWREKGKPLVVVDNTFATPVLQRPLELGADVVLHSTTKYCGGHSDVQGGALVLRSKGPLYEKLYHTRLVLGAVCSPFNSWLVLRGLRTLACRMERHSANAMAVARALEKSPKIEKVFYPGLESHAGHAIAARQMKDFGGMLSILVRGGWEGAVRVASRVKLFRNATSLGGVESLIEHRASAEGPGSTSPKNLLRLSVGLEHPDDLVEDLLQALGD